MRLFDLDKMRQNAGADQHRLSGCIGGPDGGGSAGSFFAAISTQITQGTHLAFFEFRPVRTLNIPTQLPAGGVRRAHEIDAISQGRPDFVASERPDEFGVGHRRDDLDICRNLPSIAVLEPNEFAATAAEFG